MTDSLIDYPIPISRGGTGKSVRSYAFTNLAPQDPEEGDTIEWNGTEWVVSSTLTDLIEDFNDMQDELRDSVDDFHNTLRDTLSELKKIKFGIMTLIGKELVAL